MRMSLDLAWLLTTALVALRLGVALLVTPLLAFGPWMLSVIVQFATRLIGNIPLYF